MYPYYENKHADSATIFIVVKGNLSMLYMCDGGNNKGPTIPYNLIL